MLEIWTALYNRTSQIIEAGHGKRKEVYGRDLIDLPPDALILHGTKLTTDFGTLELSLTTTAARPTFEWMAEITIKEPGNVEHYLLRPNHTIVETYGKNVFEVAPEKARELLERLEAIE